MTIEFIPINRLSQNCRGLVYPRIVSTDLEDLTRNIQITYLLTIGLILVINVVCRLCYVWQADCVRSNDDIGPVRIGKACKMRRKNSHRGLPPALWILYEAHSAYVRPPRLLRNQAKCRHLVCARSPSGLG